LTSSPDVDAMSLWVSPEMPNRRIAANQHELLRRCALTEGLQQPEESLDCHLHNGFRNLLAGRQMYDMRHASHRAIDAAALVDASFEELYSSVSLWDGAVIPPALAATAQGIYGGVAVGTMTVVMTLVSGPLYGALGPRAFWFMALLCAAALPIAFATRRISINPSGSNPI
jgi:hypothetical protein